MRRITVIALLAAALAGSSTEAGTQYSTTGWIEAVSTSPSAKAIGSFSATFVVPPAPATGGATVQFFFGAQPNDASAIVQPVLQYAAPGGWTAYGELCCPRGGPLVTSPITVQSGDTISATITQQCPAPGPGCVCKVEIDDVTSGKTTTADNLIVTSPLVWEFGAVLEADNLTDCSQLPPSGTLTFTDIELKDLAGNAITPVWVKSVWGGTPACKYSVEFTSNTASLHFGGAGGEKTHPPLVRRRD